MNILFFTSDEGDYMSDALLHGFKKIFSSDVVDYPKCDRLYKNHNIPMNKFHGLGFTLYNGLLDDDDTDRYDILKKVKNNYFDLIIFSDIERQYFYYNWLFPILNPKKTLIIDGNDFENIYPFSGLWLKNIQSLKHLNTFKKFMYFKREWTDETYTSLTPFLLKNFGIKLKKQHQPLFKISYSFPKEKIFYGNVIKEKDFVTHIVDKEIASKLNLTKHTYSFTQESEYYNDIQISKFGITTKKGGWDCMRHYEIAANNCLPCFRVLNKKPVNCAPHGLNQSNCIIYSDADNLFHQIGKLSDEKYEEMLYNSHSWINNNTTEKRAIEIIDIWKNNFKINNI
jgi:hypothetical protein